MLKNGTLAVFVLAALIIFAACGDSQDLQITETAEEIETQANEAAETAEVHEAAEEPYFVTEYAYVPAFVRHRTDIADVGDIIEFGGYRWLVLDVQGDHALIMTENALVIEDGRYHFTRMNVTWAGSTIRYHLNSQFFDSFSAADRARIRDTYVTTDNNPWFGSLGGDDTIDKIFLLSIEEVVRYFGDSGQWQSRPDERHIIWLSDEYDSARAALNDEGTPLWWWLRSAGGNQHLAVGIDVFGVIAMYGMGVSNPGGVRPALWLNLIGPWDYENFAYAVREPLHLDHETPHGDLAVQHMLFINDNLYSRKPFSYREKEAAAWLVGEFLAMGHPWENIAVQEFPLLGDFRWWNLNNQPRWESEFELRHTTQLSQNVIVTIPGQSERKIIVGAHYDSWPTPGAADNASGTSLLLESAQRMLRMDNYYTIVYVFFGGHEAGGFLGADYFIQSLTSRQSDNIALMINADALVDGPYIFYGAAYNDDWQPGTNALTRQIDAIAEEIDMGLIGHPPVAFLNSDQQGFIGRGHTVVHMSGLTRVELPGYAGFFEMDGGQFTRGVSHTQNDDFHVIEERWPGKIQRNMRAFSIFLEEMLMMQ